MKHTDDPGHYVGLQRVDDELAEWVADYGSGTLSDENFKRLNDRIRSDPEARKYLVRMRLLEGELRELAPPLENLFSMDVERESRKRKKFLTPVLAAAAVISILIAIGSFVAQPFRGGDGSLAADELVDRGVVILTSEVDAVWDQPDAPTHEGASLGVGRRFLRSGLAQLEFFSGATVVLEGPADFEVVSPMKGILHAGKLRALVPPHANGFTIVSAKLEVIDRGTEFGVAVNPDGETAVHVFEGMVDLARGDLPTELPSRQLREGEALVIGPRDIITESEARSDVFETSQSLMEKARLKKQKGHEIWKALNAELQEDPRLALYFDFAYSSPEDRLLVNRAVDAQDHSNGSIVGAQWDRGRWKNKGALDFKRPGDRIKIMLSQAFEQVTFMTWVRVDALDREWSSLLLSDNWQQQGSVHWQILCDGRIGLTVWDGRGNGYVSPVVIEPNDLGRWMHLAFVYDPASERVAHFVDGELVRALPTKSATAIHVDRADIGNWSPTGKPTPNKIRSFNGRMDEFAVFETALSDDEVLEIYRAGRRKF